MSRVDEAVETFRRWMHLPDPLALYAVLGALAANRLDGDPVWLMLVGPPSSGKTEILQATEALGDVHSWSTATVAGLLSGSPDREKDKGSTGGLLRQISDYGILLSKDFGSVLSAKPETRAEVMAALREVYDGSYHRVLGANGGKRLDWQGKCGLIAGVTPTIDRHATVMGAMGERFVLLRLPEVDPSEQARRALGHARGGSEMRAELAQAVATLFEEPLKTPEDGAGDDERLIDLAVLTARCRSAVERDNYTREIELIPAPEGPGRLVVVLSLLRDGLRAIGLEDEETWRVVRAAALDSIPVMRRKAIEALVGHDAMPSKAVAATLGCPNKTTERILDDLVAHGIASVDRVQGREGNKYAATPWTRERWSAIENSSEMSLSTSLYSPHHTQRDIPGGFSESLSGGAERTRAGRV